jgi:hypothetical protein
MIQVGVARADLILCALLRFAVAVMCMVILLAAVWAAREIVERRDIIDYDAPGVDITSEGPEGYTQAYYDWSDKHD